jgi:hypothetical protein
MPEAMIGAAATLTTLPRGTCTGNADAASVVAVQNARAAKPSRGPSGELTGHKSRLATSSAVAAAGTAIRSIRRSLDKGEANS